MNRIINHMKLHASLANQQVNPTVGFVSSYDPDNYCCKITLYPQDDVTGSDPVISGWLPVGSAWVGNGWGLFCPPSIGDLVEVDYQDGDFDSGHVDWRFYNDINRPVRADSGVFYLIHKTGTSLKFENDGSVQLKTNAGASLTLDKDGNAAVHSTKAVSLGNTGTSLNSLVTDAFMALFNTHTHKSSGAGVPNTLMTASHVTTIAKAN